MSEAPEKAPKTPDDKFESPRDVLDRDDLSYEEKLSILQRWEKRLLEQDGENADGLESVADAIELLQAEVAVDPSKPEGAPSGKGFRPSD